MKTDLQKFKDLLDEIGVEYSVCQHANDIKELGIHLEYLYRNKLTNKVNNAVSIVFNADDKFMYFEGISR